MTGTCTARVRSARLLAIGVLTAIAASCGSGGLDTPAATGGDGESAAPLAPSTPDDSVTTATDTGGSPTVEASATSASPPPSAATAGGRFPGAPTEVSPGVLVAPTMGADGQAPPVIVGTGSGLLAIAPASSESTDPAIATSADGREWTTAAGSFAVDDISNAVADG